MPVSINHQSSTYLPITSPSKSSYRHHCSSSYKSSYSSLSDKYTYPSNRYSSAYSRTSSFSDDSGLAITGTSYARERTDSTDSPLSRYSSKARSSSSGDSCALKSYTLSTLSRKSPSSRYLSDLSVNDISVSDIRSRFSSLPKTDIRPSKLSESRYSKSDTLQPSHRKSALTSAGERSSGSCEEVNDSSVSSDDTNANLIEQVETTFKMDGDDSWCVKNMVTGEQSNGAGKSVHSFICPEQLSQSVQKETEEKSVEDTPEEEPPPATIETTTSLLVDEGSSNRQYRVTPPSIGLNGLRNIGNTCFLNSVVQCLSNTVQLKEYLIKENYLSDIKSDSRGPLIKSFADLLKELWQGEDKCINTSLFKNQIQRFAPRFMGHSQQDAQEFLRYLLEGIHEDVNRVTAKPRDYTQIDDHLSEDQKATESWKRYLRSDNSKIVDLFGGQLKSTLKCTVCGHCSTTYEVFWDLSLPLPTRTGSLRLSQCLDHFTKEEVLDGDEMPTCSNCKIRQKCTKGFTIQKLPSILVLHLKRFSPTERFRKLSATVDFPLTNLDMTPYMDSANNTETSLYSLYAVSNHSGNTHSGHYTAYCRQPNSENWYHFNDSRVSQIPTRHVVSNEAYILFYQRNGLRL